MSELLIIGNIGFDPRKLQNGIDPSIKLILRLSPQEVLFENIPLLKDTLLILLDLDTKFDTDPIPIIEAFKSLSPTTDIIAYTHSRNHSLVIQAMKAGVLRVEPKVPDPIGSLNIILTYFDHLDLFKKAKTICTHRNYSQLKARLNIATELNHARHAKGGHLDADELNALLPLNISHTPNPSLDQIEHIQPNILVMEDEPLLQRIICGGLARHQCKTISALCIRDARAHLETHSQIDIALLDIGLPDGKGYEIIPEIKSLHPNCVVVMLTAYTDLELIMTCFSRGASDCLNKPFDTQVFHQTIGKLLFQQRIKLFFSHTPTASPPIPFALLSEFASVRAEIGKPVLLKEVSPFYPQLKDLILSGDIPIVDFDTQRNFPNKFLENLETLLNRVHSKL